MRLTNVAPGVVLCLLLISPGAVATAGPVGTPDGERPERTMGCEMRFNLQSQSGFYETAKGEGLLMCDNGQTAKLHLRATGGGSVFGRSEFVDGTGRFSDARTIDELLGSYFQAEVHAATGGSSAVQVLTKGAISLVLAGTGRGVDFGFTFEKITVERAK